MDNYCLNSVERQFCADTIQRLKGLSEEERQKILCGLEKSIRTNMILYLSELKRDADITPKRDIMTIGRNYVKAIIYTQE